MPNASEAVTGVFNAAQAANDAGHAGEFILPISDTIGS